ncbi:CYTOCHROME P450 FAMILY MEMBER [Salix purpurea]|uniref:CYTOCHROME P450 FAMILY MEMBER n=1 Tax=Salix purpurea TaxID=77065 RepID=A0A9Q0TVP3_SALPP|nr:CYTOCHROME P450 FAMILY MEMBER [Salix purpurea]
MASPVFYFSSCMFSCIVIILVKFFHKVWWTPIRIQSSMKSQGIKGPSYRFLHGNTKEIVSMISKMRSSPKELLHHTFPVIQPHIYSWIKLYGMNFLKWHGPQAQLIITEPGLIKEILNNKDRAYPKAKPPSFLKKLLGDGLAMSEGAKMVKDEKAGQPYFPWRELKKYDSSNDLPAQRLCLKDGGRQHIFDMLTRMAHLISGNSYRIRIPGIGFFLKTSDEIEAENLEATIRNSFMQMMKKREQEAMLGDIDGYGNDFFGFLLEAYHDSDKTKKISVDDLIDECKTFFVGGQETTSSSLTWTVLLLAIHTDWQDKARNEVLELFGQQNPSQDSIAKLKIMTMVINESLRLYSPIVAVTRRVEREIKMGKITVPANMEVIISTLAVHQNPEIWGEDVHLFKPERFAEGLAKATNNNIAAFFPFGLGPRNCVGVSFSITETKVALSMILQRYRFTLSPTYAHCPVEVLTMCPQHGVQVILQPYEPKLL